MIVGGVRYQPCSASGSAGLTVASDVGAIRSEQSTRKYRNRAAVSASAPEDCFRPIRSESGSPRSSIGWEIGSQSSPFTENSGMYRPPPSARTRT